MITEIYTLSLHDALPICVRQGRRGGRCAVEEIAVRRCALCRCRRFRRRPWAGAAGRPWQDRKSTRLNSSHSSISYAVFCWKKKENGVFEYPYKTLLITMK